MGGEAKTPKDGTESSEVGFWREHGRDHQRRSAAETSRCFGFPDSFSPAHSHLGFCFEISVSPTENIPFLMWSESLPCGQRANGKQTPVNLCNTGVPHAPSSLLSSRFVACSLPTFFKGWALFFVLLCASDDGNRVSFYDPWVHRIRKKLVLGF